MRIKNPKKPKGSVIAALDIGSSKIACFIARVIDSDGNLEVVGIGHQESKGVKNGSISDIHAAETSIRKAVHTAEKMASETLKGYPLEEVIINLPAKHAISHNIAVDVDILGHEVTDGDINKALSKVQKQIITPEHELIHTIAAGFTIDNQMGIRQPKGMVGQNLTVDVHMVTGDSTSLRNLAVPVERSHLEISSICLSSYAAGLASLVEDEMDLGCTLIDMGGGITSIAAFQGCNMIWSDSVPLGGNHVTNDLAKGLLITPTDAERIKTLYGHAIASGMDDSETIEVSRIGEEGHNKIKQIPRSQIIGIIQPRLEEIFEIIRVKLEDTGIGELVGRRVVLTGGACQLPAMRELAQLVLNKQVRLGRPIRINGLAEAVNSPAFATTAGLLTYYSEREDEMPCNIIVNDNCENIWERVKIWLKENW